eukprot:PhF_6_TR37750/c1_g1_i1/m.56207
MSVQCEFPYLQSLFEALDRRDPVAVTHKIGEFAYCITFVREKCIPALETRNQEKSATQIQKVFRGGQVRKQGRSNKPTVTTTASIKKQFTPGAPLIVLGPEDAVLLDDPKHTDPDLTNTPIGEKRLRELFAKYAGENTSVISGMQLREFVEQEYDSYGLLNAEGEILRVLADCRPTLKWEEHFDRDVTYDEFAVVALTLGRR